MSGRKVDGRFWHRIVGSQFQIAEGADLAAFFAISDNSKFAALTFLSFYVIRRSMADDGDYDGDGGGYAPFADPVLFLWVSLVGGIRQLLHYCCSFCFFYWGHTSVVVAFTIARP